MPAQNDVVTTRVGEAGLAILPADKKQSPWIENLHQETDGSWRPRYGLRLLRDFPARICGLISAYQAKDTIEQHRLYVVTEESKLYVGTINTIGAASATTYPSGGSDLPTSVWTGNLKNAVGAIGNPSNPTSTERLVVFAWPGVFNFEDPPVYEQDATRLAYSGTDVVGVPFAHGNTLCTVQKATLAWSTYGDAYTWPTANSAVLPPEIGRGIGGQYWQEEVSIIFGDNGICLAQGSPLEDALRFRVINAPPCASGSAACITKAKDRIYYMSPGPTIWEWAGGMNRIDQPIQSLLRTYGDISNYQMFYDPLVDALCVAPYVSGGPNYTYMRSVTGDRWLGFYSHATNTRSISKAVTCGPLTASDSTQSNAQPHAAIVAACGDLLSYYDPALYTDETASATFTAFTCAMETSPDGQESPHVLKRMLGVYVDGTGTWTVKLKHRTGGGSYTTVTLDSVAAPGWVYAGDVAAYQERIVRVEASSAETLRLKSLTIKEMLLGG